MIAAVAGCFSALKNSRKNLTIVFSINREICLSFGLSTFQGQGEASPAVTHAAH